MEIGADAFGRVDDPSLVQPTSHALDLLRVRLVTLWETDAFAQAIAQRAADPDARFERVDPGGHSGFLHYRNRRAAPVAWIVPRLRPVAPGSAIPILRGEADAAAFDPRAEALVEAAPAAAPADERCWRHAAAGSARVAVSGYEDDRIRLRTEAPCAGILVTSELAYPGWVATIDGRAGELFVANGAFRALALPRGDHEVELRYRPRLPWLARLVCLASLLALLASARAARGSATHRAAATAVPSGG
jgi:hypothetical protein